MVLETESKNMDPKEAPSSENKGDWPGGAENALLVIATLIAAVTFQAGVNPPGGVWQEHNDCTNAGTPACAPKAGEAGKAIYGSQPGEFYVFLISNTIGLCTSILVIILLIPRKFHFYYDIVTATVAMLATYASSILAVIPSDESVKFRYVLTAGALPFIVRGLICLFRKYKGKVKELGEGKGTGTV